MKNFIRTFLISISTSLCLIAQLQFVFAQTASILPQAETQFLDNNGKPVTSGTVDFYIPGSTTRKTTWQDAAMTIANTNPIVLNGSGRALIYGYGGYRQVLKDHNGNLIWDRITNSYSIPNGQITTGDGDAVGTVKPWAGLTAPVQYVFAFGQEISRVTYSDFLAAITLTQSVNCSSGSNILTGVLDTSQVPIGASLEASCVSGPVTVSSKTSTTYTVSANAIATTSVNIVVFPFGNGNGSTTFNVPDLRGYSIAGRTNMGGIASSNLTQTYFGSVTPAALGAKGGLQNSTLQTINLPPYTPSGTVATSLTAHTVAAVQTTTAAAGATNNGAVNQTIPLVVDTLTSAFTGVAQGGTSTPFSLIQPTITLNYIIKIIPDQTGLAAAGVQSIQTMAGVVVCATSFTCAPIANVNTIGCTIATTVQLGCVIADGSTIIINGSGRISAIAPAFGSIGVSVTGVTGAPDGQLLYNNAGTLGSVPVSGTVNIQSDNYTILPSDCSGTILEIGAFKTITLPSVAGFGTNCIIRLINGNTTRAQVLVGFPSDFNPGTINTCGTSKACLWPLQIGEVQVANAAWKTAQNPGRWRSSATTFVVNNNIGNDNNDCLVSSAPCLSIQHALDLACFYVDSVNGSPLVNVATSVTPYLPFALTTHCLGNNQIQVVGDPTTPANVPLSDGGVGQNVIYGKDKGILTVSGMRVFASVPGTNLVGCGQAAVLDLNHMEFGNVSAAGNIAYGIDNCNINMGVSNKIVDTVGGGGSIVGSVFIAERGANIVINDDIPVVGVYNITAGGHGCLALAAGTISIGSHTIGTMGGFGDKYLAELNGVIYQGAANCPGANPGNTNTGGQAS